MNEEYKFEKDSFLHIKRGGQVEVNILKPGGWRYKRPIISFDATLIDYVPRDGNHLETLAANRYTLLYSKAN